MKREARSFTGAMMFAWLLVACEHAPTHATGMASGDTVAVDLNARFYDTRMSCTGGTAAYYCTGVLIRVAAASENYHAWNSNPNAGINSVSFSFLRDNGPCLCSFGGDQVPFELALRARVDWEQEIAAMQHMEVMLSTWPQDIPEQLPLEAVFYTVGKAEGLNAARFIQTDLAQTSGRVVPIVRFAEDPALLPFSYFPEDQAQLSLRR
jgi:hypothetical protein